MVVANKPFQADERRVSHSLQHRSQATLPPGKLVFNSGPSKMLPNYIGIICLLWPVGKKPPPPLVREKRSARGEGRLFPPPPEKKSFFPAIRRQPNRPSKQWVAQQILDEKCKALQNLTHRTRTLKLLAWTLVTELDQPLIINLRKYTDGIIRKLFCHGN